MKRPAFSGLGELVTRRGVIATATAFGMSALACFPAAAQSTSYGLASKQSTPVSLKDCSREKDGGLRAICESVNRTEQAKARGAAADSEQACLDVIMSDLVKNGEKTAGLKAVPAKGAACKTARDLKLIAG
jgi:hypothetical protein